MIITQRGMYIFFTMCALTTNDVIPIIVPSEKKFQRMRPVNIPTEYARSPLKMFMNTRLRTKKIPSGFKITQRNPRIDPS